MTIHQQIAEHLKDAMRAKDSTALTVLRALKSAMKYAAIEKFGAEGELDALDAIAVVRKQIKQRVDSLEQFTTAGRADLAETEKSELVVLERYLPQALTEAEIEALIVAAIAETGATTKAQMGAVMKLVNERAAGRADGKTLSSAIMKKLG
jgi:uncharacterized protein